MVSFGDYAALRYVAELLLFVMNREEYILAEAMHKHTK
jgi:hypothetical protein